MLGLHVLFLLFRDDDIIQETISALPCRTRDTSHRVFCSCLQGWYVRVVDSTSGSTFAAIVGHMPATNESIAVLLSCYPNPQSPEAIRSAAVEGLSLPKQCPASGSGGGSESGCNGDGEQQRREMVEIETGEGKLPLEVPQLCDSTLMSEILVKVRTYNRAAE